MTGYGHLRTQVAAGDMGDPWGTCMTAWFDVAHELDRRGEYIPPQWQYRPGAAGPPPREENTLHGIEAVDTADLIRFGNTLERWARRIEHRGESY